MEADGTDAPLAFLGAIDDEEAGAYTARTDSRTRFPLPGAPKMSGKRRSMGPVRPLCDSVGESAMHKERFQRRERTNELDFYPGSGRLQSVIPYSCFSWINWCGIPKLQESAACRQGAREAQLRSAIGQRTCLTNRESILVNGASGLLL